MTSPSCPRRPTTTALRAALGLALAAAAGVGTGTAAAAGQGVTSASAPLRVASLNDSLQVVSGPLDSSGKVFSVGGLTSLGAGYVNVVNDSSTSATVTLTYQMASLAADNDVRACSQAWTVATGGDGTCAGSATTIAGDALTSSSGTYTTPTLPAGGRLYLRLQAAGAATQTSVTLGLPHYRPGQNRTFG